jgi:hypothetical protein
VPSGRARAAEEAEDDMMSGTRAGVEVLMKKVEKERTRQTKNRFLLRRWKKSTRAEHERNFTLGHTSVHEDPLLQGAWLAAFVVANGVLDGGVDPLFGGEASSGADPRAAVRMQHQMMSHYRAGRDGMNSTQADGDTNLTLIVRLTAIRSSLPFTARARLARGSTAEKKSALRQRAL